MMTKEEYKRELIHMWDSLREYCKGYDNCAGVICEECPLCDAEHDKCLLYNDVYHAILEWNNDVYNAVLKWSKEHQKYKLSKLEYDILKYLSEKTLSTYEEHMYIARDEDGSICLYDEKPKKIGSYWYGGFVCSVTAFDELFQFVQWGDEKPTLIQDVLENCEVIEDDTNKR